MSYTTNRQPQGMASLDTNKLREALISELVAINDYSEHIASSDITEINEIWHHIMEDEKRHYGMFLCLLRKYDPVQYQKYQQAIGHVDLDSRVKEIKLHSRYNKAQILNLIRDDIKGELEAVVLYEQLMAEVVYQDVKDILYQVIGDEKEHTEELTLVLMKYDPDRYGPIEEI